jgi:hypothetical protein
MCVRPEFTPDWDFLPFADQPQNLEFLQRQNRLFSSRTILQQEGETWALHVAVEQTNAPLCTPD